MTLRAIALESPMNITSDIYSPLVHKLGDFVYLRPCCEVILYWSGSIFEHGAALLKFQERALDLIASRIKFYRTETMGAAKPAKKDSTELLRFWLEGTTTRRDVYMLFLESGSAADEPSEHAFAVSAAPGNGHIRLVLPPSFCIDGEKLMSLTLDLTKDFAFDFGTAGYSLNWNWLGKHIRRSQLAMNALAPRFVGVDMSMPLGTQFIVPTGIKCANWITLINSAMLEKLGGTNVVTNALGSDASLHIVAHGAALRAGVAPSLGDVNRRDSLLGYHAVGRVVASLRAPKHAPIFGPSGIPDQIATDKWLARFDR